ncbi:MAG: hypothetical protein ACKVY0_30530 [Prosthecobacter sp.]|uniref:hypothetical protein n=1 Tax=Prosthecobacter sp. TaxID=1965333 RepID=UPI0038FDB5BC
MKFLVRVSAILLSVSCLQAGDVTGVDPDLPQPLDFSFADDLVTHSPFTRAVNLQESLQLTGIAYVDGHPIATVLNKETKQRFVVSEEPNAQGWRLMTASAGADLYQTHIEMRVGEEIVAMHYQGQQLSPGSSGKDGSKARMAGSSKKDGDKVKPSSFLGEQGREMYDSLSPEARDKFKDLMKSRQEKHPELTPEQTSDYAQKVFAKLKASDPSSAGGGKTPKPPKKKQGA